MRKINKVSFVAMIVMAVISFVNLFGIVAAGASVIFGVIFFFIHKKIEKQAFAGSGLDLSAIGSNLKDKSIWIWIALPLIMDIVSMGLAKLFLPEYIDHVISRAGIFISYDKWAVLLVQLLVLALGEEIAWRAFFQKQLLKMLPIGPVLLISSFLFSIGHITKGSFNVVAYDVFFVFINSILYGIVFHKTQNAWISTISHFIANLFSVIVLAIIPGV